MAARRMPYDAEAIKALREVVTSNNEETQKAHKRLREDMREQQGFRTITETALHSIDLRLTTLERQISQPVEASTIRFTFGMVIAVVVFVVTVVSAALLVKAQLTTIQESLVAVQQMQKLNQIDINNVKENLAELKGERNGSQGTEK